MKGVFDSRSFKPRYQPAAELTELASSWYIDFKLRQTRPARSFTRWQWYQYKSCVYAADNCTQSAFLDSSQLTSLSSAASQLISPFCLSQSKDSLDDNELIVQYLAELRAPKGKQKQQKCVYAKKIIPKEKPEQKKRNACLKSSTFNILRK